MKTMVGRFKISGWLEGLSFLILVFIAMPLKYAADHPDAVKIVGMIHGILFPLYLLCLIHIAYANRWSASRWIVGFLVGFLPFGTFIFTGYLNKKGWR